MKQTWVRCTPRQLGFRVAAALGFALGVAGPVTPTQAQSAPPVIEVVDPFGQSDRLVFANRGTINSKGVMVLFEQGDPSPLGVECTGIIRPGAEWAWPKNLSKVVAGKSYLVKIYSFTAQKLSEVGVNIGFDDVAADTMCETLFFGIVGDPDDNRRFELAFRDGLDFAGINQAKVYGAPLAVVPAPPAAPPPAPAAPVTVERTLTQQVPKPVLDNAVANPQKILGYGQPLNPAIPAGPMNPLRTCLTLQTSGKPWHPVYNSLVFKAGCQ